MGAASRKPPRPRLTLRLQPVHWQGKNGWIGAVTVENRRPAARRMGGVGKGRLATGAQGFVDRWVFPFWYQPALKVWCAKYQIEPSQHLSPSSVKNQPTSARLEIRLGRTESGIGEPLGKRSLFRHRRATGDRL